MKASRAPGPVSYVKLHANKAQSKSADSGARKPAAKKSTADEGQGGQLTQFRDLDNIPDFSWDAAPIVVQKSNINDYGGSSANTGSYGKARAVQFSNRAQDNDDNEDDYEYQPPQRTNGNRRVSAPSPPKVRVEDDEDDDYVDYGLPKKQNGHPQQPRSIPDKPPAKSMGQPARVSFPSDYHLSSDDDDFKMDSFSSPKKKSLNSPRRSSSTTNYKSLSISVSSPPPPLPCEKPVYEAKMSPPQRVITEQDKLFFTKQPRNVEYKPYTLKQYQLIKPKEYVEIGNIKPDLNTDELVAKRKNAERIKQFSKQLRSFNKDAISAAPKLPSAVEQNDLNVARQKYESKRQKAIEFARQIPKPAIPVDPVAIESDEIAANSLPLPSSSRGNTAMAAHGPRIDQDAMVSAKIQELQAKHEQSKVKMAAIKKSMGGAHTSY